MYIIRNSILCFVMVSVISIQNAGSQSLTAQLPNDVNQQSVELQGQQDGLVVGNIPLRMGIGVQCGIRFHQPEKFDDFVTDVWNSILAENVYVPIDKKSIGPGVLLTLNGTIDIGSFFSVMPFVQGMWAGKQFYFRGGQVRDVHINTYTAMGGLNLWARIIDREAFAFRLGAGGYRAHTIARITGDASKTVISGGGFGFRGLLGTELRLNRNIVLTLDCGLPIGNSEFDIETDKMNSNGSTISYPTEFDHFGFELCPGILFYF